MEKPSFILKGDICHSEKRTNLCIQNDGYVVCLEGKSQGVFPRIPGEYGKLKLFDYTGKLIIPGLTDLHAHAPQYGFRALGMDMELLDWLNTRAFPEEAKYADEAYARKAYTALVEDLKKGPNTRICFFATLHVKATLILMELLEKSGLVSMVGRVNMDRNSPGILTEKNAASSLAATREWLDACAGKTGGSAFRNTEPILTPRFIPSCSDSLMRGLSEIQKEYGLPLQSHLSENRKEIAWVKELCPESENYGGAYARFDLFGGGVPTIMAHCVWSGEKEIELLAKRNVFAAHCPQSNMNLSSGIAPVRRMLEAGVPMGLGSDVAGGTHTSIFRAMSDAIQVSKLRQALIAPGEKAITLEEAFWLGTAGGGAFFGGAGSFQRGCEFDALVIDDSNLKGPFELSIPERLERLIYLSDDRNITAKYIRGENILRPRKPEVSFTLPPG
jgi:guanine deaminase